jgi:hypothetical protein
MTIRDLLLEDPHVFLPASLAWTTEVYEMTSMEWMI